MIVWSIDMFGGIYREGRGVYVTYIVLYVNYGLYYIMNTVNP